MSRSAIVVDDVTKEFKVYRESRGSLKERFVRGAPRGVERFTALDRVSFEVPRGSTFALIGHNGCGKSTMLKLLAGVYRQTSGTIHVDGRVSALLELGAGFHGDLTGRENIRLNGAILGFTKRQIDMRMDAIIEFADIGEFIDLPVKVYSSGMYVRLGFSVAVMLDPEILIVDEIIAVGDEAFQRKCFDHLFELRSKGVSIALVTHSMSLAQELCDEAIWLSHGKEMSKGPVGPTIAGYLDSVNQAEEEKRRQSNDEKEEVPTSGHRGEGGARIIGVDLLNPDLSVAPFFEPGEPVYMRLRIAASTDIDRASVGIGVITENGLFIAGASSNEQLVAYDIPVGTSDVVFTLPRMQLQPGTYRLAASITKRGRTFDYVENVTNLIVRSNSGDAEPGYFRLDGEWDPQLVLGREKAIDNGI